MEELVSADSRRSLTAINRALEWQKKSGFPGISTNRSKKRKTEKRRETRSSAKKRVEEPRVVVPDPTPEPEPEPEPEPLPLPATPTPPQLSEDELADLVLAQATELDFLEQLEDDSLLPIETADLINWSLYPTTPLPQQQLGNPRAVRSPTVGSDAYFDAQSDSELIEAPIADGCVRCPHCFHESLKCAIESCVNYVCEECEGDLFCKGSKLMEGGFVHCVQHLGNSIHECASCQIKMCDRNACPGSLSNVKPGYAVWECHEKRHWLCEDCGVSALKKRALSPCVWCQHEECA